MKKTELLAPAGDMEKLRYAYAYGADAAYCGLKDLSLRKSAGNFTKDEMAEAVALARSLDRKLFVTLNIIARNRDIDGISDASRFLGNIGVDGIIVADPGLIGLVQREAPGVDIHISTQANTLNSHTAALYASLGAKRIILARELSLEEIKQIRRDIPAETELEAFVHGAMCVSYSGRCLISNYMAGRDANRGECTQPCRWKYALVEEQRPGEYFPVHEDERGTYFFNSRDLCMIRHIPEMMESGLSSFKIEGRMKSLLYTASVTMGYRQAMDAYCLDPGGYVFREEWMDLVSKASHREYTTAFYFDNKPNAQIYHSGSYIREQSFAGRILEYDEETKTATILQKSPISNGDTLEVINPDGRVFTQVAGNMTDKDFNPINGTPHPHMVYHMKMENKVGDKSIIMKKEGE
ncbi:MAG: U32 family peptidase [Clostridia bacterium]